MFYMNKLSKLKSILNSLQSVVVAYSGGLDSTFLLSVALETLGAKNVLAVNALSDTYPSKEAVAAKRIAKKIGAKIINIKSGELSNPKFVKNPRDRCYHCKYELFSRLKRVAQRRGLKYMIDGSNKDDLSDWRPGSHAARELGVRSPLQEAEITKKDIRKYSKKRGLPTWDKPSFACLASRFPYGIKITKNILKRLDKGENYLRKLGFRQVRARHHGNFVSIEVDKSAVRRAQSLKPKITKKFKRLGYADVTIDPKGYRTGSLNEALGQKG